MNSSLNKNGCSLGTSSLSLALRSQQRLVAEILAIQMKKVEGTEDQFLRLPPNSLFERLKVRDPTLILNNHLAVDDCGAAVKLARCLCYAEVAFAPIEAIAV